MNNKLRDILVRAASGAVLVVVLVGGTLLSPSTLVGLLTVIVIGAMSEFYNMASIAGLKPQKAFGVAVGFTFLVLNFAIARGVISAQWLTAVVPVLMIIFVAELYRKQDNPIGNIAATITGIIYVALPVSLLLYIAVNPLEYRPWVFLGYIFMVWASDVGAYLFGVAFGRHKLFERISPKKSWEGFAGGLICAVGVGALIGHLLGYDMLLWGIAGAIVCVSGVYGDLVESLFKRSTGIKDSGAIMPGHGGFLDRFDAMLISAPFVYIYFVIFNL